MAQQQQQRANEIGKQYGVMCFRDRQFACSAAAQHRVGSTKQQTNKANTQQAIIIIIIDRYRY